MSERAPVAHHFEDAEQQHEAATLGMWLFLVTEVMFFGGLFTGYLVYRLQRPAAFIEASSHLYVSIGAINTFVLLTSSLTMALAVRSASLGQRTVSIRFLLATIAMGLMFLVFKAIEYTLDIRDGLLPGYNLQAEMFDDPGGATMFLIFYFITTALHSLHMIIGIGVLSVIVVLSRRGWFSPQNYNGVEMTGLYWHFVDIVWIFLFPLYYLIGW